MKALITGVDYSNFGSLAMLAIVKKYYNGETVEITYIEPESTDDGNSKRCVNVIRIRDYLIMFLVPVCLDRFFLNPSQRIFRKHFQSAQGLFDISGFALSSQFRVPTIFRFLGPLVLGAKHDLDMILMPQSFGPFQFPCRSLLLGFVKRVMRKLDSVYARDNSSLHYLSEAGIKASFCTDSVFLYNQAIQPLNLSLSDNKYYVGVVTNRHLLKLCSREELIKVYQDVLTHVIRKGYIPVIFSHTLRTDEELLFQIVEALGAVQGINKEDYIYIETSLSLANVSYMYSRFDFIISSRFHSVVLNYVNKKPAVILGWAEKYNQLAEEFEQHAYLVGLNVPLIIKALDKLIQNRDAESEKIAAILSKKQYACANILKTHLQGLEQSPFLK